MSLITTGADPHCGGQTPFEWDVRVYYEDTDAAGVVYHSNYLAYMERARTEWLRARGIGQDAYFERTGLRFAVTRMEIDFRAPARLDDLLTVSVALTERRPASIVLGQRIIRSADGRLLIRASAKIACVDARLRPRRMPADILGRPDPDPRPTESGAEGEAHPLQ